MKNKILAISILITVSIFVSNVCVASQNNNIVTGGQNQQQLQQQTKTINQGEMNQIQTEAQVQQKLQNENGEGNQVQNQTENENEINQIQNKEQETQDQDETESTVNQQRRSRVATAVQEILQVAERSGGIGQQVRIIAQTQNQNQEKIEASLQEIQNRNGLIKFFIGPNYAEIKNSKKILEQNREQIEQLNQIKNQLVNQGDQQTLTQQIQTLEQTDLEIENSLKTIQKGFSLFGWVFKLFSK